MVHVSGTYKITLIAGGERVEVPGNVPPGDYKVEATPPDAAPFIAGKMTAVAGTPMKVLCSEALRGCRIREY